MSLRTLLLTSFTAVVGATLPTTPATVQAQQAARPALVLGGLSTVGVLVPIGTRWVLRPDVSLGGTLQYLGGGSIQAAPRSTVRSGGGLSAIRLLDAGADSLQRIRSRSAPFERLDTFIRWQLRPALGVTLRRGRRAAE